MHACRQYVGRSNVMLMKGTASVFGELNRVLCSAFRELCAWRSERSLLL